MIHNTPTARAEDIALPDTIAAHVQKGYDAILAAAIHGGASDKFIAMSERYAGGFWRNSLSRIRLFKRPLHDSIFVDFGSKFGHIIPLASGLGVRTSYCVDIDALYLSNGAKFIGTHYDCTFLPSHHCYVDIPSNHVDFIYVNDVLGHINPSYLSTFFQEMSRILKPGGEILIIDENNIAHLPLRLELLEKYAAWEKGESQELGSNYRKHRRQFISKSFAKMDNDKLEWLTDATTGLWGENLLAFVQQYLEGGSFTPRDFRYGQVPAHPRNGILMEGGYFPEQIETGLALHAIEATQLVDLDNPRPVQSMHDRGYDKLMMIHGTKIEETPEALAAFAKRDHERRLTL